MKKFIVDVDITMSRSVAVSAKNESEAKELAYEIVGRDPYNLVRGFAHYVKHEIIDIYEE